ncbi:hypothetical protein CDO52_21705 [Nocardiopsis gilva YIM 90087]|uniref:DUF6817 domain-containing protein n=2 Tax=Nocardiopsis gilva TaxID=280236 RepID=A0A223SAD7_9ACTN|nr:hypothetical protein CDO52_21705 [Nocardiopsis gilva YIM 90087]
MQQFVAMLESRGARKIRHPGGDLLAHLTRVAHLLESWGADGDLCVAGLCHACYGTDEFGVDLFDSARRDELTLVIGHRAEALVYVYAACDRKHVFPQLGRQNPVEFRDRFTDTTRLMPTADLNRFMELTAANELDLVRHNTEFKEQHGHGLLDLFTRTRKLLSAAAWRDCQELLET